MASLIARAALMLAGAVPPLGAQDAPQLPRATIPFDVAGASTPILKMRVNGSRPLKFIVDTGANSCLLNRATAQGLSLPLIPRQPGRGAGAGTVTVDSIATAVTFGLPGVDFSCDRVYALDLSNQPSILGDTIDGIIRYDLFGRFVVEMERRAKMPAFVDTENSQPQGGPRRSDSNTLQASTNSLHTNLLGRYTG